MIPKPKLEQQQTMYSSTNTRYSHSIFYRLLIKLLWDLKVNNLPLDLVVSTLVRLIS